MAGRQIALAVDASTFAGLDPDDYPDGQRLTVTDDGEKEYEARGADGSRTWVLLHEGHVDDHEADAGDPHAAAGYLTQDDADALYDSVDDAWMPLVSIESGTPQIVLDADDSLIPTKVPL